MRFFLLPVSTQRTLIYCERVQEKVARSEIPLQERLINRASTTWAGWEKAEKGWQKQITVYGNQLFRRIPFEEWSLKTCPPLTAKRREAINNGKMNAECHFPGAFLKEDRVPQVLATIARERQPLHRKRMWQCIFWAPFTIPFALVPVIPNIPFFYLVFRAWSHYKAYYGSMLLNHMLLQNRINFVPSAKMDELYAAGLMSPTREATRAATTPSREEVLQIAEIVETQTDGGKKDAMLLQKWNGKLLAEGFNLPEMEIEIERAVEQVEKAIKPEQKLKEEKQELQDATVKVAEIKTKETKS